MAWRRRRWRALQAGLDPRRLVFIDETWIKTNMVPLRGWAPKGQRLCGFAPQGRWRTLTFLGALRWDGLTAPCIFDGPINGQCFRAYVEQLLLPALRPGDIVVLDNLGSHKAKALRPMLKTAGARLWYLPPYSPDLNPIEKAFSKIKHWMRLAQKLTPEGLSRHIGDLIKTIRQLLQLHSQRRICSRQNVKRSSGGDAGRQRVRDGWTRGDRSEGRPRGNGRLNLHHVGADPSQRLEMTRSGRHSHSIVPGGLLVMS